MNADGINYTQRDEDAAAARAAERAEHLRYKRERRKEEFGAPHLWNRLEIATSKGLKDAMICPLCGAISVDVEAHIDWHELKEAR